MQLLPHEIAVGFLDQRWAATEETSFPDPRAAFRDVDDAHQFLKDLTGEDFGIVAADWESWFEACPKDLLDLLYEGYPSVLQSLTHPRFPERLRQVNERWKETTNRQCSRCTGLCPEYREHCWACGFAMGRNRVRSK